MKILKNILPFVLFVSTAASSEIHSAVQFGNVKKLRDLLEQGADFNAQDHYGETPLIWSIYMNEKECFDLILKQINVEDVNEVDRYGDTALHVAATVGNEAMCRDLLRKNANFNAQNKYGQTPYEVAKINGNVECADMIGNTALHFAVMKGNAAMCHDLLEQGANVNAKNDGGRTPLMASITFNKKECFDIILKREGVKVNVVDEDEYSALHLAAAEDNKVMCHDLLEQGANVNAQDVFFNTPLIMSIHENERECFDVILNREGVDVNAVGHLGSTPLHYAAMTGNEVMCRDLLEHGANVNAKDYEGRTPLMESIMESNYECFDIILKREGVEVNAVDEDGNTALHFAAMEHPGNEAMCRDLLKHGANVRALNKFEKRAHYLAFETNHKECEKMILSVMDKQNLFKVRHYVAKNGNQNQSDVVFSKIKM